MIITPKSLIKKNVLLFSLAILVILCGVLFMFFRVNIASALSGSEWRAGNIIDDSLFYNGNDMSVDQVQSFLNQRVPNCDTNGTQRSELGGGTRAQYAASQGYSLPIICLKDYYENPTNRTNNLGNGQRPAGSISAAQIIKNAAVQNGIGTKVLLVILEKEMSLVSDTWPLPNSYRKAMGFACPDTAPCDAQYYGFANQVSSAARQYVIYKNNPSSYRHVAGKNNAVLLKPNSTCGSTTVYINTTATAGLYNYTPYQPNQAALNNLYGTGDGCSSYGNRNFWTMYNNMFGSSSAAPSYGYNLTSKEFFSDAARQNKLSDTPNVEPGSTFYAKVTVKNTGNQTWYRDTLRLGGQASRPSDFATDGWISPERIGSMLEESVSSGSNATFIFKMRAPSKIELRYESFGVLIEGQRWLDGFFTLPINVTTQAPYFSVEKLSFNTYSNKEMTHQINSGNISLYTGSKIYVKTTVRNTGNQPLPANITKIGTTNPLDRLGEYSDETWMTPNRVTTAKEGVVTPGSIATFTFSLTAPASPKQWQTEQFGVLIEGQQWLNNNIGSIKIETKDRPSTLISANQQLEVGQSLLSADERFQLILQGDGNLVLYSLAGALWSSGTANKGGSRLILQSDGNLVLYRSNMTPIWSSGTSGRSGSTLLVQVDGNLVLYASGAKAVWNTRTSGH